MEVAGVVGGERSADLHLPYSSASCCHRLTRSRLMTRGFSQVGQDHPKFGLLGGFKVFF